jgi:hypothetical protein
MELTEADLSAIETLLPERPWLLMGLRTQIPVRQFVDAYLPPTTDTSVLRRGTAIGVWRSLEIPTLKPIGQWSADSSFAFQWAQVEIPGRNFEDIHDNLDMNRPFRVGSRFDDAELVSLVEFLRSNSGTGEPASTLQPWPVQSVERLNDGSVRVSLLQGALRGQSVHLRQSGQTWVILDVAIWIA